MVTTISLVLFLAAVYYTLAPLMSQWVPWMEPEESDDEYRKSLQTDKLIYLKALKDIDFERASHKINIEDYEDLKSHYKLKLSQILEELEELRNKNQETAANDEEASAAVDVLEHEDDEEYEDDGDEYDDDEYEEDEDEYDNDEYEEDDDEYDEEYDENSGKSFKNRLFIGFVGSVLCALLIMTVINFGKKKGVGKGQIQAGGYEQYEEVQAKGPGSGQQAASKEDTIVELTQYLEKNPSDVEAFIKLGDIYYDDNRIQEAIEIFSKAEKIAPNNLHIQTDLGALYSKTNQIDLAIKSYEAALIISPSYLDTHFYLGQLFRYNKGDNQKALKHFEKILASNPNKKLRDAATREINQIRAEGS
jgi:tetratricopeptide (TPR) repeat protein